MNSSRSIQYITIKDPYKEDNFEHYYSVHPNFRHFFYTKIHNFKVLIFLLFTNEISWNLKPKNMFMAN
jgi:hypothetical protein